MNVIKLNATHSTNSYLLELSKNNDLPDKTLVVAAQQLQGRGQLGTHWQAVSGDSLTFSVFKKMANLHISKQPYLLFAVAIGIRNALEFLMQTRCHIKWTNDIMAGNKKIAGILIENQVKGSSLNSSVIGIGINVNNTGFTNLPKAGSLFLLTKKKYDLDTVMTTVCDYLFESLSLLENNNFAILKSEYEKHLFKKNKVTTFLTAKNVRFNGIVRGVTTLGQLMVEVETEAIETFNLKEITMLF